jgi:ribosome-binding factor A
MMEMYDPEAKIMYGWGRERGTASKKEYEGILPQRIKANRSINLTITKIDVQEDKAKAAVDMKVRGRVTQSTFELIKENDKWLITRFSY